MVPPFRRLQETGFGSSSYGTGFVQVPFLPRQFSGKQPNEEPIPALRPGGQGDVTASHVAWKVTEGVPRKTSPALVGFGLYLLTDDGNMTPVLTGCMAGPPTRLRLELAALSPKREPFMGENRR